MAYDELLVMTGEFKRYQIFLFILLCLPNIFIGFHMLGTVFLAYKPEFKCRTDTNTNFSQSELFPANETGVHECYDDDDEPCEDFLFSENPIKTSMVSDFLLICSRDFFLPLINTCYMGGFLIGSFVFGCLSDRYGRKLILNVTLTIMYVFGGLVIFAPEKYTLLICRFFMGAGVAGVLLVPYVMVMELVGPNKRSFVAVMNHIFFACGYMLMDLIAYFIRKWKYLEVAITVPMFLFISFWWIVPESIRWHLDKGHLEKATTLFMKMARFNKVDISEAEVQSELIEEEPEDTAHRVAIKKDTLFSVFKYPNLRRRGLFLCIAWLSNGMVYYGLSWGVSNLTGNFYLDYFIYAVVEIPTYTFVILTVNRWGRKFLNAGGLIIAACALIPRCFIPSDNMPGNIITISIAKICLTASYDVIFIVTAEIFPTGVRNSALGAGSLFSRVGAMIAPFINNLDKHKIWLPHLIFGIMCLVPGVLCLWIPESMNKKMPITMEEGELLGTKKELLRTSSVNLKAGASKSKVTGTDKQIADCSKSGESESAAPKSDIHKNDIKNDTHKTDTHKTDSHKTDTIKTDTFTTGTLKAGSLKSGTLENNSPKPDTHKTDVSKPNTPKVADTTKIDPLTDGTVKSSTPKPSTPNNTPKS